TLAQSSTFRRIFALVSMIYGILILPTMLLFSKISTSADSRAEIANKALPIYLLFLLGIALYIFLIVFFDFHLGNLCWLLLPYIGGPVFA
ncbi:CPBP family intramembrane metalloprotease, partial [Bacillus thuringiensis]|nr:CPBP family intramembrane metalloprotease [Bacillus thuringiensis]